MKSKKNTSDKPLPLLNLNSLDGRIILVSAVRYALTRSTYVNPATSQYVNEILPLLNEGTAYNIATSISSHYDMLPGYLSPDYPYYDIDIEPWLRIYERIMGKPYQRIKEETDA